MLGGYVRKLKAGMDQFPPLLVQGPVIGHVVDNVVELVLRDRDLRLPSGQAGQKLPHPGQHPASGAKMRIKKHSEEAVARAHRSLYFFPMLLGSISPAKKMATVHTRVPTATQEAPQVRVTSTVTRVAVVIWTIFVPISMAEIAWSKCS